MGTMTEPKITIITPVYNKVNAVGKAIRSVSLQTYKNVEHVIIDGESDDGTVQVVRKFQEKFKHIVLLSEKDDGVYSAMNKGLNLASGDWICFMGADDKFYNKQVLARLYEQGFFGEEQIVYGNVIIEGDSFWAKDKSVYDGPFDLEKLFKRNLCHQSVFYPRSVIERVGTYNEKYAVTADWDYNIRCFAKYPFLYADMVIAVFRSGGKSSVGGDESLYHDLPGNVIRYFGLEPDKDEYHNFNSPFYLPMSRYREQKSHKTIMALSEEISQVYKKLEVLSSDHADAEAALNAAHEQSIAAIQAENAEKETSLMKEFKGSLASLMAGKADIISRLEQEHAAQLEAQRKSYSESASLLDKELESLRERFNRKEKEFIDQLHNKELDHGNLLSLKEKEFIVQMNRRENEFNAQTTALKAKIEQLSGVISNKDQQITNMVQHHQNEVTRLQGIIAFREEQVDILFNSYRWRIGNFLIAPVSFIYRKFRK